MNANEQSRPRKFCLDRGDGPVPQVDLRLEMNAADGVGMLSQQGTTTIMN